MRHNSDKSASRSVRGVPGCGGCTILSHTVVELIVVVGIALVLLALLFPILNKAKGQALSQQESSQLKQLSVAHGIYLADHNDAEPGSTMRLISGGYASPRLVSLALDPFPQGWANTMRQSDGPTRPTPYKDSFKALADTTSDTFFPRFVESQNGGWLVSASLSLTAPKDPVVPVILKPMRYKRLTFGGAVITRTSEPREISTPIGPQLGLKSSWLFSDEDVLAELGR